jgi:serine/threonine protein kinase
MSSSKSRSRSRSQNTDRHRHIHLNTLQDVNRSNAHAANYPTVADDDADDAKRNDASLYGIVLDGRFQFVKMVGEGSFGQIYEGVDVFENAPVAIKTEQVNAKYPQLRHEYRVYRRMQGGRGIPDVMWYGMEGQRRVMVMEMLGKSLEDLFQQSKRRMTLKTVLMLAEQMMTRVEWVHSKRYVHRDIKPENFLMPATIPYGDATVSETSMQRRSPVFADTKVVHLIDFGLSKRFRSDVDGQHIPYKKGASLTGTPRYASVSAHEGSEQGRRDDMVSLGYIWIYFLKGRLPWQGVDEKDDKRRFEKILEIKRTTSAEELCSGVPQEFLSYFRHCAHLGFEDRPDYSGMRRMFRSLFTRKYPSSTWDAVFDWDRDLDRGTAYNSSNSSRRMTRTSATRLC